MSSRIPINPVFSPDDRPRLASVLAVLFVLGLVGFGLTRASLEDDRGTTDESETPTGTPPEAGPTPSVDAPTAPAPVPVVVVAAATDAATATPEPLVEVVEPETPAPALASGPGTIVRGRIAYIRCDGVPQREGPNPCPRDTRVESAVWAAIDRLPTCGALAGHRGSADVRVVFDSGTVSGLGFRDLEPPMLDRALLSSCLEPALRDLRASVPASRMTAAFRFDIR